MANQIPKDFRRVIVAASVGNVIEWYDFYIFGSLAAVLSVKFFEQSHPVAALLSTIALFTTGFLIRPLGAFLFGWMGDRVGRKYTFLITLSGMGLGTGAIGLIPTYASIGLSAAFLLFGLRMIQGLCLGGECGGAGLASRKGVSMMKLLTALAAAFGLAIGVATPAQGVDDIITLGAAVSLSGVYSTNGKNTRDGYDLAVKVVNDKGGVKVAGKAYRLAVKYYDDESTPARGAQLADRLISQDGVKFLLGPYSSGLTKAIAPITEKYKITMIQGNGADRDLFTQGYRYNFAVLSTSDQYLASAIQLLGELTEAAGKDPKQLKVAIAIENDPFSQDVRDGVSEDAKKWGMRVVIDDKLPPDLNDMSATLTKAKALKPDILVVSGHTKGVLLAVRQVAEQKVDVPMLASTHCDAADVIGRYGKLAEYWLCGSQWDRSLSYEDSWFGTAEDFAQLFSATYHYEAPYQAAESAAAVLAFADAFNRTKSLDPSAVRDAIAATDMETFYGKIKYDVTGKNIAKPMVLYQVQNGKYMVVAPQKWASSKMIFPVPSWSQRAQK
jgi:branched-chain amino acid transport system substrate-binding protein